MFIKTYNTVVMIIALTVGTTDSELCFSEVLRNFGYECTLFEAEGKDLNRILDRVKKEDYLLIHGNVQELKEKDLVRTMKELHKEGVHVILSVHTEFWKKISGTKPFLMIPCMEDLEKIYHEIRNENDAMRIIVKMHDHSHGNVMLPLKKENKAVFVCSDGRQFVSPFPYEIYQDDSFAIESMLAGFLAAYLSFHDYVKTFHYALSAYSVSAFKGEPAKRKETEDTYQTMKEKRIWMK